MTEMTEKLYIKFSLDDRQPRYGSLPMPAPGERATESRGAKLCEYGWHACLPGAGGRYIGTEAYLVRLSGETQSDGTKVCGETIETVSQLPWTRDDMVAFAQACATRAREYAASAYAAAYAAYDYAAYATSDASAASAASAARAAVHAAAVADHAAAAAYYAATYYAAADHAAADHAAAEERAAQWRWIIDRLAANGADLSNVEGT